jgi:phenylacetate-coenzyme A ligase PaaK-like adenylate-forming protein
MQYIHDLVSGKERERMEPIEGRVDDIIVYMLLFKAILLERK